MDCSCSCEGDQIFWSQIIEPHKETYLDFHDNTILTITSACIPDVEDSTPKNSIKLKANVKVPTNFWENEENDEKNAEVDADIKEYDTILVSLMPFAQEHVNLNLVISPLTIVNLTNIGSIPIHLAGYETPIDNVLDEDFEEEEQNQEQDEADKKEKLVNALKQSSGLNAEQIQNRFKNMISKQEPPPKSSKKGRHE